jgi:hypothetical protein
MRKERSSTDDVANESNRPEADELRGFNEGLLAQIADIPRRLGEQVKSARSTRSGSA